jgi:hypothetical protein
MAAQAKALVVVLTLVVGVPQIDDRARQRIAAARKHQARKLDDAALDPFGKVAAAR